MGGRAGGGARGGGGGAGSGIEKRFAGFLSSIPDPTVRKEMAQALADYEKEFGIRQDNITLKIMSGKLGYASSVGGKSYAVYLDQKTFTNSSSAIKKQFEAYKGFLVDTKQPLRQVLVHELGHATWSKYHTSPKAMAAKKEVLSAYRKFLKGGGGKGWGDYSKTSYGEWFAEGVAKHMYGTKDAHTKTIVGIIKKYGL